MFQIILTVCALIWTVPSFCDANVESPAHGISIYGKLKYPASFTHFDYVNPKAPKRGTMRLPGQGTFDSFNPHVIKGMAANGIGMIYATLTVPSMDESGSRYGYLAASIELASDRSWVIYHLRPEACFHDGSPVTAEDVLYSFHTLIEKGAPHYKSYYENVTKAEALSPHAVKFTLDAKANRELPMILGEFPVFSKTFMEKHGFEKADLTPPLGNGPYKVGAFKAGHYVTYDRVKDWWGENVPANKGRYNFDHIRYDYLRDEHVAFEAFKNHTFDFRVEGIAKTWATGYNFPAAQSGKVKKLEVADHNAAPMQGFAMNTRRDLFKDRTVREALGLAFDFEWTNAHLFHGLYTRTKSYFDRSPLACSDVPTGPELALLEPFRKDLPPELFTQPYAPPSTAAPHSIRENLKKAKALLAQAGWHVKNNQLVHETTGKVFTFEILLHSPTFERILQGYINNLKALGIQAHMRLVDPTQYIKTLETYQFDMTVHAMINSLNPGNEQRRYWHSAEADKPGGDNLSGVKDPLVDHLVDLIIHTPSYDELLTRTHALDRVLLWGHYTIPNYYTAHQRIAHWDNLIHPDTFPDYGVDLMAWWSNGTTETAIP